MKVGNCIKLKISCRKNEYFSANYPETLKAAFVLNASSFFQIVFKIIQAGDWLVMYYTTYLSLFPYFVRAQCSRTQWGRSMCLVLRAGNPWGASRWLWRCWFLLLVGTWCCLSCGYSAYTVGRDKYRGRYVSGWGGELAGVKSSQASGDTRSCWLLFSYLWPFWVRYWLIDWEIDPTNTRPLH